MLIAPGEIAIYRYSPWLAGAICFNAYLLAQKFPQFNLPGGSPEGDWQWNFNPAAWQLLFFGGMWAGRERLLQGVFGMLEEDRRRAVLLIALLISSIPATAFLKPRMPAFLLDKENLGILRVAHALFVVLALSSVIVLLNRYLSSLPARLIALTGRQTLDCYAATIPLTYGAAALWIAWGHSYALYFIAAGVWVGAVILIAWITDRRRTEVKVRSRGEGVAAGV